MPVVIVSWLDCVDSTVPAVAPGVEAVTRTGVLIVPALTMIETNPWLLDVAVGAVPLGVVVIPPTLVLKPNVTTFPASGFPPESKTLKVTVEVDVPPVPCSEIVVGKAETYWIEPVAGGVTTREAEVAAVVPDTEAVTVSVLAQPLSR